MATTSRELKYQVETTESIKLITQALGDIATAQIKRTRQSVERNIKFFEEISQIYQVVKSLAARNPEYQRTKPKKNGKTVCILLTSNYKFYGGLDSEVTEFFLEDSAKYPADRIVIGVSGQDRIKFTNFNSVTSKITLKKDFPSLPEMKLLSEQIFSYSKILVYHSKFETLLNQVPVVTDISESANEQVAPVDQAHYILEPEIAKMMAFFETQIIILLLQAIFLDADIARTAARMVSMNHAGDEADKVLLQEKKAILHFRKDRQNRRILEIYAGIPRRHQLRD